MNRAGLFLSTITAAFLCIGTTLEPGKDPIKTASAADTKEGSGHRSSTPTNRPILRPMPTTPGKDVPFPAPAGPTSPARFTPVVSSNTPALLAPPTALAPPGSLQGMPLLHISPEMASPDTPSPLTSMPRSGSFSESLSPVNPWGIITPTPPDCRMLPGEYLTFKVEELPTSPSPEKLGTKAVEALQLIKNLSLELSNFSPMLFQLSSPPNPLQHIRIRLATSLAQKTLPPHIATTLEPCFFGTFEALLANLSAESISSNSFFTNSFGADTSEAQAQSALSIIDLMNFILGEQATAEQLFWTLKRYELAALVEESALLVCEDGQQQANAPTRGALSAQIQAPINNTYLGMALLLNLAQPEGLHWAFFCSTQPQEDDPLLAAIAQLRSQSKTGTRPTPEKILAALERCKRRGPPPPLLLEE